MSLYQRLVEIVEEARGAATQARDEDQAWAGKLCEKLAAYLDAPPKTMYYTNPQDGRVMLHAGFLRLQEMAGWHGFQLEIATDVEQRHRFLLPFLFQTAPSDPDEGEHHLIKLGSNGREYLLPTQTEEFFDHVFAAMVADLETPEGRETARRGGVRRLG
jgi:hypothetical protein